MGAGTILGEGSFPVTESWADRRRQKTIDRLASKVVEAVNEGEMSYEVMGSWRSWFATTHEPKVYAAVAEELRDREEPIEIEVQRFMGLDHGTTTQLGDSMLPSPETIYTYDFIHVQSIGSTAIEHEPYHGRETHARIYPPEN